MGDMTLIKYTGGVDCNAIGGQNPAAVQFAQIMMAGNEFSASQAQDVNLQNVVSVLQGGQGRSY